MQLLTLGMRRVAGIGGYCTCDIAKVMRVDKKVNAGGWRPLK